MLLDLQFTIGTLGLAMGTFIAGLYGMNLDNHWEETRWGFIAVTGASMVLSLWVYLYGIKKLRAIRRVRIPGDDCGAPGGRSPGRYHWFYEESHYGLLDSRNRAKLRKLNEKKANSDMKNRRRRWFL
jgi:magnesium transporter